MLDEYMEKGNLEPIEISTDELISSGNFNDLAYEEFCKIP